MMEGDDSGWDVYRTVEIKDRSVDMGPGVHMGSTLALRCDTFYRVSERVMFVPRMKAAIKLPLLYRILSCCKVCKLKFTKANSTWSSPRTMFGLGIPK